MTQRSQAVWGAAAVAAMALVVGCSKAPDAPAAVAVAPAAAANVSDQDVTEHVKTALQRDETLKAFNIQVVTTKGDVRLTGQVGRQSQIADVIRIARMSEGAHSIHDELTVKP